MSKPNDGQDRLDRLTEAFANLPVPEGPDVEVTQRLMETLAGTSDEAVTIPIVSFWRRNAMRKLASAAAVLLVVLSAFFFLLPSASLGPGAVFAAMLEEVKEIRSATYETRFKMQGQPEFVTQTSLLEPGWLRQVSNIADKEFQQVVDAKQGKSISLFPGEKEAIVMELTGQRKQEQQSIIQQFRLMSEESATFLGEEDIEGVSTLKYLCDQAGLQLTVWTDPNSRMPIKVVMMDTADASKAKLHVTFTNFVWNAELDESLFTLEIPDGYTIQKQAFDVSKSTEEDLAGLYRIYARLNGDTFPDEILNIPRLVSFGTLLEKSDGTPEEKKQYKIEKLSYALDAPDLGKLNDQERSMKLMQPMMRGMSYYQEKYLTHHWHYQGKGIKLGEADKIVAWWYPKKEKAGDKTIEGADLKTAQVLYGDLRIETMPVAELPKH